MELKQYDVVLCEFYFSDLNKTKKRPVLVFKDNLPHPLEKFFYEIS